MNHQLNALQIKTLDKVTAQAPASVIKAIHTASNKTGVDFSYLVQQANVESSFDPKAKAGSSSATGLYQFIDSTWLQMVDRYGQDYGIVTDGMSRKEILSLRNDPKASSFMAAAFASENEKQLNDNWGGKVGSTELYLAHFLGAGGASSFLNARDDNPLQAAADQFPGAARANRNVFYDQKTGRPRTMEEVYQFFDKKFEVKSTPQNFEVALNDAGSIPTPPDVPSRKIAQEQQNSIYAMSSRNALSDSIVMQRAQAMRENANNGSVFTRNQNTIASNVQKKNAMPLYNLNARPVDVMLLTQTVTPNKVIRDKIA